MGRESKVMGQVIFKWILSDINDTRLYVGQELFKHLLTQDPRPKTID
jgi:hypothetical protein